MVWKSKAKRWLSKEHRTGFDPRLCEMIAQLANNTGGNHSLIRGFYSWVFRFYMNPGPVPKIIDHRVEVTSAPDETISEEERHASTELYRRNISSPKKPAFSWQIPLNPYFERQSLGLSWIHKLLIWVKARPLS